MPRPATLHFHFRPRSTVVKTKGADDFLSRSYEVACNGQTKVVDWNPSDKESLIRMQEVLERFTAGCAQFDDIAWIAPRLRKFLACNGALGRVPSARERGKITEIEFSSHADASLLLTNIPWEATALTVGELSNSPPVALHQLMAGLPLVRVVPGDKSDIIPDSRLRALYCISNPTRVGVSKFDAESFKSIMETVFGQFPMIDVRASRVRADLPSSGVALAEIRDFRPHVFFFVGHGDSGHRGENWPALCFEKWVDASEFAECLLSTRRTFLASLICCDMTRDSGAQSGAYVLTKSGIPNVLAMQGNIQATFARSYLEHFLSTLLVSCSVSLAGSNGRIASAGKALDTAQTLFPSIFRSKGNPSNLFTKTIARYRDEVIRLAQRVSAPRSFLSRPNLEQTVREALETQGLVHVSGGLGSGKTTLLAQVIHDRLASGEKPPARPIFYVTCDTPEYATGALSVVTRRVKHLLEKHNALLPEEGILEEVGPEAFATFLDHKRLILVLDNVLMGSGASDSSDWKRFLGAAREMKMSLVLVAESSSDSDLWNDVRNILVDAFSDAETEVFVSRFMPNYSGKWKRIYKSTGGLPLLLDALRLQVQNRSLRGLYEPGVKDGSLRIADTYVNRILRQLLPKEVQTLCNLCWLPRPTTKQIVGEFFDCTRNRRGLQSLVRVGILRTAVIDGTEQWDIPGAIVQSLGRVCAPRVKRAAKLLTDQLERSLPKGDRAISRYLKSMGERVGGLALLGCMQRAYIAQREFAKASAIPVLASKEGLLSESRWELFAAVLPEMRKGGDFAFLLSAGEVAQAIGKQKETKEILDSIAVEKLTPYYRIQYLKLRAAMLKDTKQHEGLGEILALYAEAIALCEQARSGEVRDGDASEADWTGLLCDLLQGRLNALSFLQGQTSEALHNEIEKLRFLEGRSPAFAYSLCLVVECELNLDERAINWNRVAENLLEARELLRGSRDDRILSQLDYLYGQYLGRKPTPELKDAVKAYRRAEEAAKRSGEPRRLARARRRWVELEWRSLARLKPTKACELLEEVIPPLEAQLQDSLGARMLERIYTLRAEIGGTLPQDPTDKFLRKACLAAASPMLLANSDHERLVRALIRYLDVMKTQEDFTGAQQLVHEMRRVLKERLRVEPIVNDPWKVRESLVDKMNEGNKEGKWA
jgi:hypothetical protein